ncbi:MAG: hypothetical protein LBH43_00285 [Treponema sp.]|jgi:hypothetical protein|nr:hypothetical protein [Treponema sp.]
MKKYLWTFAAVLAVFSMLFGACSDKPKSVVDQPLSGSISIQVKPNYYVNEPLTAVYTGGENVSYQWKKSGTPVGTDSATFTPTEPGYYTVTVSAQGYINRTSTPPVNVTQVAQNPPLSGDISIDSKDSYYTNYARAASNTSGTPSPMYTGYDPAKAKMTATYTGSEQVVYQWQRNGEDVGTNSNEFTPALSGSYTVTVSASGYSPKTSAAVTVKEKVQWYVNPSPLIMPSEFTRLNLKVTDDVYFCFYKTTEYDLTGIDGNGQIGIDYDGGTPELIIYIMTPPGIGKESTYFELVYPWDDIKRCISPNAWHAGHLYLDAISHGITLADIEVLRK